MRQLKIRFKKYNDVWENVKLTEIAPIVMGQSPDSKNYTDNPNDYILVQGNADMKNGRVVPRVWTTQVTKLAEKGDLILSVRAPVGDIGKTDYNVVLGRGVAAVKGNEFLFQLLTKMKQSHYWLKFSTGSTFESINSNDIKSAEIYLPSVEEQSAIGSLFRTLDDLLASYKNNLANYQSLKTTMLSKMFPKAGQTVPEIRLDGFDGEWECVKMEDIFQIIDGDRGKSYPGESDFSSFGHTLFLDTGNVKKTGLDFSTTKFISEEKDKELRNGKLILGDFILTSRGTLGNVAYYDENIKKRYSSVRINSAMLILRPLLGDKISHEYILAIFRGNLISDFMKVNQVGSAQPHITKKEFSKIKVQVPSNIREQQAIGTYFTNLDNLISAHQEKITQLETLKKKLLQDMFI
ncbi:restriction endonuclease subunit S [Streptococcus thermophilus]|uniref:restriction endonuclease subunit S n=1 Tax=Streptococcus thermophilus TaxID=1308 RepID=UPI000C21FB67|nr:restriction endonuclease subunit S [Streptococcus thermophilus]PJH80257.1 restriction endonuclease subunit S [Streptococcus thermophilus]PJH82003.1 restriction endonuclease subunit S [Streptococcus thermophilus]